MSKGSKYQWQGEPVDVEFGFFHTKPNVEKRLMWYNYECETSPNRYSSDGSCAIEAIRFTYDGHLHVIANHYGIGEHKLRHGGWPSHQHFDFGAGRFNEFRIARFGRFDEPGFAAHEALRESWMKKTDPEAYFRIQLLRDAARKLRTP